MPKLINHKKIEEIKNKFDVVGAELRISDKALPYKGTFDTKPVFLKILTSTDPKWVNRFKAEVKVYRYLQEIDSTDAYEITPKLVRANISVEPYYLVMEWKDNAKNYSPMRWAEKEVEKEVALGMGETMYKFHNLMKRKHRDIGLKIITPVELARKVEGYFSELPDSYFNSGIKDRIIKILPIFIDRFSKSEKQIIHGDPLFTNFMTANGHLYLVDWEYAVVSHPAHDLASFWVTSSLAPKSREFALNRYKELNHKWDESFEKIYALFRLRYALREFSLLSKSRGYHTTFTREGKQAIIKDQIATLEDVSRVFSSKA